MVAPIGSLVVVINLMFTPLFQKEMPSKQIVCTTTVIVLGSMVATVWSPKNHENYENEQEVLDLYSSVFFVSYALVAGAAMAALAAFHGYCQRYKAKFAEEYEVRVMKAHRFAVGALSGMMGAQNILFAKGVSTMMVFTVSYRNSCCFLFWEWYLLLLAMIGSVWFQLKWLNYGLKYFSPMQIIPVFQSFWTLIGIIGGLIVYQEFTDFKGQRDIFLFSLGCLVIIGGILYLTTLEKTGDAQGRDGVDSKRKEDDIVSAVSSWNKGNHATDVTTVSINKNIAE